MANKALKSTFKKIMTPNFRVGFPAVFEPKSFNDGDPRYSVQMMFPKDETDIDALLKEVKRVRFEAFGKKKFKEFGNPIQDGDEMTDEDGEEIEATKGYWIMRPWSKRQPGLIDQKKQEIIDEEEFYAGCWARATINFWPYSTSGNKGVSCSLHNLQKVKDDKPFGNRTKPEEDFDELEVEDDDWGDEDDDNLAW